MKRLCIAAAVAFAVFSGVAEEPYTCSMRVDNSSTTQKTTNGGGKSSKSGSKNKSSKSKTVTSVVSWPVTVSLRGKNLPAADAVKLKCYFIGVTDGKPTMLQESSVDVSLDEKGNFKTEVTSPETKLVHTTTTTTTGGNNGRGRSGGRGRGRNGNTSKSLKTSTSGTRVTGCIIQLIVNGKVEKSYASNSGWSKFAKVDPIQQEEVLKIR